MGYLMGSINPATMIAKRKEKNIREIGTGNAGATNVMLNFGKGYGALVMLFDIAKAVCAFRIAELLFPGFEVAGYLAGAAAVVGHIFPFYLGFKGGKGLAPFGGFVLASNPMLFHFLLLTGLMLMLVINYGVVLPYYGGVLFPVAMGILKRSLPVFFLCATASLFVMKKHASNLKKALNGDGEKIREYIATKLFAKK
jgi:glycerol-3-phosphate acyltransferase PlsY